MFPEVNTPDGKRRVLLVSCYPSHFCAGQLSSLMEEVLCPLCALSCGGSGRNKKGGQCGVVGKGSLATSWGSCEEQMGGCTFSPYVVRKGNGNSTPGLINRF